MKKDRFLKRLIDAVNDAKQDPNATPEDWDFFESPRYRLGLEKLAEIMASTDSQFKLRPHPEVVVFFLDEDGECAIVLNYFDRSRSIQRHVTFSFLQNGCEVDFIFPSGWIAKQRFEI